jgi:heme exporter protein D
VRATWRDALRGGYSGYVVLIVSANVLHLWASRFQELEKKQKEMEGERQRKRREKELQKQEQNNVLGKGGARPKLSFSLT